MSEQSREDLNAQAAELGVESPEALPNKQAVLDAIAAATAPAERSFTLQEAAEDDEDAVTRVSVGCEPRVSVGAGEVFTTANSKLAEQLAGNEHLQEVTGQ